MKFRALLLWLSIPVFLGGCSLLQSEPESSDEETLVTETEAVVEESSIDESQVSGGTIDLMIFDDLVKESDFSNQYGFQAWLDYIDVSNEYEMADLYDLTNTIGSSSAEIDAFFDEDIERAEAVVSENEKMVFYRYPDEPGGSFSDISSFLAEITFYFVNDMLVFSAVTPGFYNVTPAAVQSVDVLSNVFTIPELAALDPHVLTIAEMTVNGEQLRQVMVPSQPTTDQTDVLLNAFYLFVVGDEVIHHAIIPFTDVSQDFPSGSVTLYNSYFNWLNEQQ